MNYSTIFIAFFCLLAAINIDAAWTGPITHRQTETHVKQCLNHENNLFKEIGSTTTMSYETTSEIAVENGQKTQVNIKAKVDVSTISKCEHVMRLRKVQIDGPKEAEIMKKQLERHAIKFTQDNGRLESIFFDDQEETWVLNLKKAILSAMQVSVRERTQQIVEKDVLGYCKTKYEQTSSNTVQKTKYLSSCSKRSQSINSILTGDFDRRKKSVCKIHLSDDKQSLKSVVCEETNSMLPFAQSKASAQISTITKLSFDKTEQRSIQIEREQELIKDNLTYNKKHYNKQSDEDKQKIVESAERLIDEIRSEVEKNVKKETPEKIKKLKQKLAELNVRELERLAQHVSNKDDKVQDIFFDTVAQTGTQETAHIILKVILDNQYYKGEVSKVRSAFWLSMLSNVDKVTDEVLTIAAEHLRKDNLPRQALLALTSMIDEINDDEEIKQDRRYQQVVMALIEKLNGQSDDKEKVTILKALRNTGLHSQVFDQVLNFAQKKSNDVEVRIAAVEALEDHVDEERFYRKLFKIFEDQSNEAELRIATFKVLTDNQEKVHELYNVLKNESNKQVGSYVVSYFKNAKESQLPEDETLRRIASTFDLPEKRFERSDLRQSKHIQFTQHISKLDLSAQVESDLVFDEQKELRSVRARFDLNKENVQLKSVEIQVRQKGLPEVAQQMLQQLTRQTNLNAIVDEIKDVASIRSKHQLKYKINRFIELFNLNKINLRNSFSKQADASIHVRFDDKTVLFVSLKDIQEYSSTLQHQLRQRDQIFDQIFDSLKGDNAFTLILSGKQHKMPTVGLPVHSGNSIVIVGGLKIENQEFYPSIAADYHYEIGFTAMSHIRPAVHYHLQMSSAPGWKVKVNMKNGLPISVQISMPEERLDIFTIKSTVKLQTANEEIELNASKNELTGRTNVFDRIFGVELAYRLAYPRNLIEKNAWNVLFNGPFEMVWRLEKTDSSINYWEAVFETPLSQRSGEAKKIHLALRAVGSRKDREVSAKIELQNERDSKVAYIDLKTPIKSAKIEARAQYTDKQVGLKAALIVDNQRYEAQIGGEKTDENGEKLYRPSIKFIIPGFKKIHYTGKIGLVNSGKKENYHVELKNAIDNSPLFKASFIKSGRIDLSENFKIATDLHAFWFDGQSIRFVSNVDKNSNGFTTDLEAIHTQRREAPTTYKWKLQLRDLSNSQNLKYNADFELNVPRTEFENIVFSWNFVKKADQEIESELTGFWNRDGRKTRQVHILQQSKMNKVSAKISSLNENLLKIEIVPLSIHYEVQAKTNWQRSQQKYNVALIARNVKTNKQYKGEMSYAMPESRPFKMNLDAKVIIENDEFKVSHNIEEKETKQYHGHTMVQLRKGEHVEFNYVYRMKEHSLQIPRLNHELDAEIRVPSKSIVIKNKSALKLNAYQFEIKHSLRSNNNAVSEVKISLNKNGPSSLHIDNEIFQVKADGDLSQSLSQIDVSVQAKKQQIDHQTKLTLSHDQIKISSQTRKDQRQVTDFSIDHVKYQKTDAKIVVEKLGELIFKHQPNSQKWATIEMKSDSDYFSKPIRQTFTIEKQSDKKYTIRSKTQQDQQVVGEVDIEIGSQSSLRMSIFDWKLTGKTLGKEMLQMNLQNSKLNINNELKAEYIKHKTVRFTIKHDDEQRRASKLTVQLSIVDETKAEYESERKDVQFSIKPIGQEKHVRFTVDDKKHNIQHKSELSLQDRTLSAVLEHTENNEIVVKHNTKLSFKDDSYTKTETKKFQVEAIYKWKRGGELRYNHQNGIKHSTIVEIVDSRNKIAKLESKTTQNGKQIVGLEIEIDTLKKVDLKIVHKDHKVFKLSVNMKDQHKYAEIEARSERFELQSKWNKDSTKKEHKYTLKVEDKERNTKYDVLGHYQRKTLLHIKLESSAGQTKQVELRLHKSGQAFFKIDGKDAKLKTDVKFEQDQAEASVEFENRKHSIRHETTATYSQRDNELKIKSQTDKRSKQIANVDLKINPTTKDIYAVGEIDEKKLKIEGNVLKRFTVELKNEKNNQQFRHHTQVDFENKIATSETIKNGKQVHKSEAKLVNRKDIDASIKINEHELVLKTNERDCEIEVNYENKKHDIRSTGQFKINRKQLSAKLNGQQRSKQVVDFETNLQIDEQSFDAKLNVFQTRSSIKIDISRDYKLRAHANYEDEENKVQRVRLSIDTTSSSEKQVTLQLHTQDLKIEKAIRLLNNRELRANGKVEHNGKQVAKAEIKIAQPFDVNGKLQFDSRKLKGEASIETVNDEIRVQLVAKDGSEKKIVDLKSKLSKGNDRLILDVEFDSHQTRPFKLTSELRKEHQQLILKTIIKSRNQQIGHLNGKLRVEGLTVDAELKGELNVDGERSEINYKLNNDRKVEHILKVKSQNKFSYGYEISMHLKEGKFIIHLLNRVVELRYDLSTQTDGHVLLKLQILPNSQHQPNHIYTIIFDNQLAMHNQELIMGAKTTIKHPEINHPIEIESRFELREFSHQRPLVAFVSFDASSNQQNKISSLFEILNESNVTVAHYNLSHKNKSILDIHYRWVLHSYLAHQRLSWSILKQYNQKQTGEFLSEINLKQRHAKLELNNKHKLQLNWESSFDKNTIVQLKAQTENMVRKTKIMTNNKEKQIEISNYENERLVSNYVVSALREKNTLFSIELHKKEGSKYEKVAFAQLVKDNFNYAKVHLKADKSLVYKVEKAIDDVYNKVHSSARRHNQEISSIIKHQIQNIKLEEQYDNASKLSKKAIKDVSEIANEYVTIFKRYLPRISEAAEQVWDWIADFLFEAWEIKLDEHVSKIVSKVLEQVQKAQRFVNEWKETVEYQMRSVNHKVEELKDQFDHEIIARLSKQLQENFDDAIRFGEEEGEKVYEFVRKNLNDARLDKLVQKLRHFIIRIKNQIKQVKMHENLRDLINNYQQNNIFEGKWSPRGDGEIIGKVYYPTKWIN